MIMLPINILIITSLFLAISQATEFNYDDDDDDDDYNNNYVDNDSIPSVGDVFIIQSSQTNHEEEHLSIRMGNKNYCNQSAANCVQSLSKEHINEKNLFTVYEALEFIMTRTNITSNEEYDEILKNVGVLVSKINQYYESPTGAQLRNSDAEIHVDFFCQIVDAYMNMTKLNFTKSRKSIESLNMISRSIETHFQTIKNESFIYKAEYSNLDIITFNPLVSNISGIRLSTYLTLTSSSNNTELNFMLDSKGLDPIRVFNPAAITEFDSIVYVNKDKLYTSADKYPRLSFVVYKNDNIFKDNSKRNVISNIVSVTTGKNISAKDLVVIHFPKQNLKQLNTQVSSHFSCAWWDHKESSWSREGCNLHATSSGEPYCICNHTTNFAIILDINDSEIKCISCSIILEALTYIGCSLSIAGLVITLIVLVINKRPKKKALQSSQKLMFRHYINNLAGFCASLLMLNITFIVFSLLKFSKNPISCMIFGVLMHYSLLSTFLWMLSLAILQYLIYIRIFFIVDNYTQIAFFLCFTLPIIPIAIVLSIDWMLYVNSSSYCWPNGITQILTVIIPICVILAINICIFVLIIREHYVSNIFKSQSSPNGSQQSSHIISSKSIYNYQSEQHFKRLKKRLFAIFSTLTVNTGLTWLFGLFLIVPLNETARILFVFLFCIFNSFQGIFIFLTYVLVTKLRKSKK